MTSASTWNSAGAVRVVVWLVAAVMVLAGPESSRAADEEGCLGCHGLPGFAVRAAGTTRNLWLDVAGFDASAHSDVGCRECHGDITSIPHGETREVGCGQACHGQSAGGKPYSHESLYWEYAASSHGSSRTPRIGCLICHPEPGRAGEAERDKLGEARRCAACHRGSARVAAWFFDRHAIALAAGSLRAPSCPDCHSAHGVRPVVAPESPVAARRLAETCAKGALAGGPRGGCHSALAPSAVAGAGMSPFSGGSGSRGGLGGLLTALAGLLLAGLIARAGIGLARGR